MDGFAEVGTSAATAAAGAATAADDVDGLACCPAETAAAEAFQATFLAPSRDTAAEQVAVAAATGAVVQKAAGAAGSAPCSGLPPAVAESPNLAGVGGGDRRKRRRKSSNEGTADR